ncbi:MAG: PolC-type DNA polymerase III, partial [Thermaurantimonas sp.]
MYAVIDIESTGGKRGQEKIIEIAIFRFDGKNVTDQLISLVNVCGGIHPYVQKLTGITPAMLRRAPKFYELAKRIIQITDNAVIVGHNVAFDYRMLEQEFASLGYEFSRKTLDTIPMTRKLIPGLKSYGLENISRELNIYNPQRHRAAGDARVTLELFKILLEKDQDKEILSLANPLIRPVKNEHDAGRLARLLDLVQPATGVYYLRNSKGEICKTGSAKNLYSELQHIFLLDDKLKDQIADVQTMLTGNDLISYIKLHAEASKLPDSADSEPLKMHPWQIVWTQHGIVLQKYSKLHPDSVIAFEKRKQALNLLKKLQFNTHISTLNEARL